MDKIKVEVEKKDLERVISTVQDLIVQATYEVDFGYLKHSQFLQEDYIQRMRELKISYQNFLHAFLKKDERPIRDNRKGSKYDRKVKGN